MTKDKINYNEPEDCWLYHLAIIKDEAEESHPELPLVGGVSADLVDPDVFCLVLHDSTVVRMKQGHKKFYKKGPLMEGLKKEINELVEKALGKEIKEVQVL